MPLVDSANYDRNMNIGSYAPLAGVSKPMLDSVKDIVIESVSQVQTLVWSGAIVADNVINGKVGGVAIAPVTYAASNAATLTALAAAILAANDDVLSAVSDGTDTITVTTKKDADPMPLTDFVVTLGVGQVTATITETVVPISMNSLLSGVGVKVTAGVPTLATDDETHIVVGSFLNFVDGSYLIDAVESLPGQVPIVEKSLARVQCRMRVGEVIAKGDNVAFKAGLIVKRVAETNYYVVEQVDLNEGVVQIKFKS